MNRRAFNRASDPVRDVFAAMQADAAEVVDRLSNALTIDDRAKREKALADLSNDLPMLLQEMNASPETAQVIERILLDASERGLTT